MYYLKTTKSSKKSFTYPYSLDLKKDTATYIIIYNYCCRCCMVIITTINTMRTKNAFIGYEEKLKHLFVKKSTSRKLWDISNVNLNQTIYMHQSAHPMSALYREWTHVKNNYQWPDTTWKRKSKKSEHSTNPTRWKYFYAKERNTYISSSKTRMETVKWKY